MAKVSTRPVDSALTQSPGQLTPASRAPHTRNKAVVLQTNGEVILPDIRANDKVTVDQKGALPTSLQSDFIPEDLLLALTQPPPTSDKLGPPSRYRNLNTTAAVPRKAPDNVWNYPKRREKLKHLTKNTPCVCGAGKDISFLCDVPKKDEPAPSPHQYDPSSVRVEQEQGEARKMTLPDTLIPEEYHIVKNKGVMGLEYHEEKFSTQPEDHERHLVQFPSLNPTSRFEVLQLQQTLEEMLDKIGANEFSDELEGATQMHNLLELIKKEQNIYNVVFHELIRQVSVECIERGQLLSSLRGRYSQILNKVPRQIKGLHEEVLAQRALDRRLTEELMRFKSTIGALTSELTSVKEHDQQVTRQANQAQDELKSALAESQKNASLLAEYHALYELQRKRLEAQVSALGEEREIWSTAAYSLALKVTEEHSLHTARRLHVAEKSWAKLATHFTVLLSDADTAVLTELQGHVEGWRALVDSFEASVTEREEQMRDQLRAVRAGMMGWVRDLEKNHMPYEEDPVSKEGHLKHSPDATKITQLYDDVKAWEELMTQESEKFGGDTVLSGQEFLSRVRLQMYGWTDCAVKIFSRHSQDDGAPHPDHTDMDTLNQEIELMLAQYQVRLTGENGVATGVIHINNMLESWSGRLSSVLHGSNPLADHDWLRLYQLLEDWAGSLDDTTGLIGSTEKEASDTNTHRHIELSGVLRASQKWLSSITNGIDSEDGKLVEAVSGLHTEMIKWMVQTLLRLAPDRADHSSEARAAVLLGSVTLGQLTANAKSLSARLAGFTEYVTNCCKTIVAEDMQRKMDLRAENADYEFNALKKLKRESEEWVTVARLLLTDLTGETFTDTPAASLTDVLNTGKPAGKTQDSPRGEGSNAGTPVEGQDGTGEAADDSQQAGTPTPVPGTSTTPGPTPAPGPTPGPEEGEVDTAPDDTEPEQGEEPQQEAAAETSDQLEQQDPTQDAPAPSSDVTPGPPGPASPRVEMIGRDDNTHPLTLAQSPDTAPPHAPLSPPGTPVRTPDTRAAYEALGAMETLQGQLLTTEERAQTSEDRAMRAEASLKIANQKIRALQRELGIENEPAADQKAAEATDAPAQAETPPVAEEGVKDADKPKEPARERSKVGVTGSSRASSRASGKSKKK